jgi:hypothetical protein
LGTGSLTNKKQVRARQNWGFILDSEKEKEGIAPSKKRTSSIWSQYRRTRLLVLNERR